MSDIHDLADVLVYAFLLARRQGFDIREIIMNKMARNAAKYPVHLSKGNARKYDEF